MVIGSAKKLPPMHPDEMGRLLQTEKRFTSQADVLQVEQLYRTFFERAVRHATFLNLRFLKWGDTEIKKLAEVLPYFSSLEKIDLYRNNIGNEGIEALAKALPHNKSLTTLKLGNNRGIGQEYKQLLKQALVNGRKDSAFDLSW